MIRRRTLLRAVAAAPVAAAGAASQGCATAARPVQVAVVWSGGELQQFRNVLAAYQHPVEVISAGDNIDAFLRARQRTGARPDVAVLPRPGLVTEYAANGWLSELDDRLADAVHPVWADLLRHEGALFGAWVKAAHKSLFWYFPSVLCKPPQTWDELTALVRELGADSDRSGTAPLAIGAADGWVLTDWFENVLAAISTPGFYNALARGEAAWTDQPVEEALTLLAQVWSLPGAFPGGPRRALLTQFAESVIQVVTGRAAMVFEGDFVAAVAADYLDEGGEELSYFRFPSSQDQAVAEEPPPVGCGDATATEEHPLVVGGDAAVALRGSAAGQDLIAWLSRPESFVPWIRAGGYLSPHRGVPLHRYRPGGTQDLAAELADATEVSFDLSDQLPGTFTGADGVGIWRILQEFFADVAVAGSGHSEAVGQAVRRLAEAARQAAPLRGASR